MMEIRTVGVLGCGLMGAGIAQVCAASGFTTIVREVNEPALEAGLARIRKFLDDGVAKGKVSAEARAMTLGNLSGTTVVDPMSACDIVIEAIVERSTIASMTMSQADIGSTTVVPDRLSSVVSRASAETLPLATP